MVDEMINFLSSQKTSSIKTVYLVIFMPGTFQAFQQVLAGQGTPDRSDQPDRPDWPDQSDWPASQF